MKKLQTNIVLFLLTTSALFSSERKMLLEMFTNAHCYACVAAYELFRQYRSINPLASKSTFIFYHITQPGVEDSIYYQNKSESDGRNDYYGPYTVAPLLFADGAFVGTNPGSWQQSIASRYSPESPFDISISGTVSGSSVLMEASVTQTGDVTENDLRIYIVLTESVQSYIGKNGVTPQVYAMRKMLTGPTGEAFFSIKGGTKKIGKTISLNPQWDSETMFAVAFIQSASKKIIYQSQMKSLTLFTPTTVKPNAVQTPVFSLEQNYPNPFNPSTTIRFGLESDSFVRLRLINVLGETVSTIIDGRLSSGEHSVQFNGARLPSGMYFYRLESNGRSLVRSMMLLK